VGKGDRQAAFAVFQTACDLKGLLNSLDQKCKVKQAPVPKKE
jgi:hypothetical protein